MRPKSSVFNRKLALLNQVADLEPRGALYTANVRGSHHPKTAEILQFRYFCDQPDTE